jgi:hypothetical protein
MVRSRIRANAITLPRSNQPCLSTTIGALESAEGTEVKEDGGDEGNGLNTKQRRRTKTHEGLVAPRVARVGEKVDLETRTPPKVQVLVS